MTESSREIRDIFRAEDGSEWHAWISSWTGTSFLWVGTAVGVGPIDTKLLKKKIEGLYRVWSEI